MNTTRLRYVAELNPSVPPSVKAASDHEVSFLPMEAIGEDWTLDLSRTRRVDDVLAGYSYFEDGDIVFAKVTPCFENGKAAVVSGLTEGVGFGTTEVTVVRPSSSVNTRYLFYILNEDRFRQLGVAEMTGAGGLRRVPDRVVRDFSIRLPSRDVQDARAMFLDRETAEIDAFIADQEELIRLLTERRDAGWQAAVDALESHEVPLRRVIDSIVDGPFGSGLTSAHYSDSGARVVRLGNIGINEFKDADRAFISLDYFAELSNHSVRQGDVVVAGLGDDRMPLGRAAVVPDIAPAIVKADCYRLRPGPLVTAHYLAWVLSAPQSRMRMRELSRGSTRQRLNTSVVRDVMIPLPSIADQERAVAEAKESETELAAAIEDAREAIALSRERRAALISAAVTGKIDVREQANR